MIFLQSAQQPVLFIRAESFVVLLGFVHAQLWSKIGGLSELPLSRVK